MAERRDLLDFLVDPDVRDTVFARAQTHISIASDLRPDPTRRARSPRFDFCAAR